MDDLAPVPPPYLIRQSSRISYALTIFSMSTTIAGRMSQKIPRRYQSIRKPRQFIRKASHIYYALTTNLLCPDYGSDNGVTTRIAGRMSWTTSRRYHPPFYLIRQFSPINYALTIFSMSTAIAGRMSQKIPRRCQSIRKPRHSLRKARPIGCLTTRWSTKVSCHVTR